MSSTRFNITSLVQRINCLAIIVSLLLAPIPRLNIAWAESKDKKSIEECVSEDGVYIVGCKRIDSAVKQAKLTNYTENRGTFLSILQQVSAGISAVTMLDTLRWDYLYEAKPELFGNDCSANTAASWTMPFITGASAMYLVGELITNFKFRSAAQIALEAAKFNTSGSKQKDEAQLEQSDSTTEEKAQREELSTQITNKNEQIRSFEALIGVMESQQTALQAKIVLSSIAQGAYLTANTIELIKMIQCQGLCVKNRLAHERHFYQYMAASGAAKALIAAQTSASAGIASQCTPLLTLLGTLDATFSTRYAANQAADAAADAAEKIRFAKESGWFTKLYTGIYALFKDDGYVDEGLVQRAQKRTEELDKVQTKIMELGYDPSKLTGLISVVSSRIASITGATQVCTPDIRNATRMALESYLNYNFKTIECCGGMGLSKSKVAALSKSYSTLKTSLNTIAPSLTGESLDKISEAVDTDKLSEQLVENFGDLAKGFPKENFIKKGKFDAKSITSLQGFNPNGTLAGFGVPTTGAHASKNDIEVKRLIQLSSDESRRDDEKMKKLFVKHGVESALRKAALAKQNAYFKSANLSPKQALGYIADQEQELNNILFFFDKIIEETNDVENLDKLASHKNFSLLELLASKFLAPDAHASWLQGAFEIAAGVGLKALGAAHEDKPWMSTLNFAQDYLMLSSIISLYSHNFGYVKPAGRVATWSALSLMNAGMITTDSFNLAEVGKRKKEIKAEKQQYLENVGGVGVDLGNRNTEGERGSLDRVALRDGAGEDRYVTANTDTGQICLKNRSAGGGFSPSPCPSKIDKSQFNYSKMERDVGEGLTFNHMGAISDVSKYASGFAQGNMGSDDLAGADLNAIQKRNAAIRDFNQKLMKQYDEQTKLAEKNSKEKSTPLAKMMRDIQRGVASMSPTSGASAPFPNPLANTKNASDDKKDEESKEKKKVSALSSAYDSSALAPESGQGGSEFDFGFKDTEDQSLGAASTAKQKSLADFEINHDDIHKKKDVSIFRILSNRYLLSYPKVLEEDI